MTVKPLIWLGSALVVLASPVVAAETAAHDPSSPRPAAADPANFAANWDVDKSASHLKFTALQKGSKFTGEFEDFDVKVDFDPSKPEEASLNVAIVMKSADAGDDERNESLPTDNWFGVKTFPVATFRAQGFKPIDVSDTGSGEYSTKGILTVRDIQKPLTLTFDLQLNGDTVVVTSNTALNRGDFKVGQGVWATDEWVSLNVDLDIQVTASRK